MSPTDCPSLRFGRLDRRGSKVGSQIGKCANTWTTAMKSRRESSPVSSAEGTPGEASAASGAGGEELDMMVDERGRAAESFITIAGCQGIKTGLFKNQDTS